MNIRGHWRYKRFVQQVRIFPSQITRLAYQLPPITVQELVRIEVEPAPLIEDGLCLPNHATPRGHNDVVPLLKILRGRQPAQVLELGTAHGNTAANICVQCPNAKIYTVNALPEQISGELITYALTRDEIGRVYKQHGYGDRVTQIFANTLDVDLSSYLESKSLDLAIIDACHDTSFVLNDFAKVQPYMKPGGVVLLHDTHPSMEEHLVGSYRACMTLRRRGFDMRHIPGTWWGVWLASSGRGA